MRKRLLVFVFLIFFFLTACDRYYYISLDGKKEKTIETYCGTIKFNMTTFIDYNYNFFVEGFYGKVVVKSLEIQADGQELDYEVWFKNNYYSEEYIDIKDEEEFTVIFSIPDSIKKIENFSISSQSFLRGKTDNCGFNKLTFPNKILE